MFMGHYSVALALKGVEKKASLGWLFLAAQLVDILLIPFVFIGIERLNIVENFTPSTHFELEFVPYTHSLVGTFVLAVAAYLIIRILPAKEEVNMAKVALVIAAAIFSHWFLDLIVHTPDLPLLGDNSPKLGFGVWNNALRSFSLEAVLILAGVWLYLRGTRGTTVIGKYGMPIFAVVLILSNAFIIFGPPPESLNFMALLSLVSNFTYVGIAFWLDRKRS
jgi:membrane-bound metal-dependent hydrolase YbcI (DUF457 family)